MHRPARLPFLLLTRTRSVVALIVLAGLTPLAVPAAPPAPLNPTPITVVDLQLTRSAGVLPVQGAGGVRGIATLTNLNPHIGTWWLLEVRIGGAPAQSFHLEVAKRGVTMALITKAPGTVGLRFSDHTPDCELGLLAPAGLAAARASHLPFAPLCDGRAYLRNAVTGHTSLLEQGTDFLRDHTWGGDEVVNLVKNGFFKDHFLESGEIEPVNGRRESAPGAPLDAALVPGAPAVEASHLEIRLVNPAHTLDMGRWYAVRGVSGVYLSAVAANHLAKEVLAPSPSVNALDTVESRALDYLVAFDTSKFHVHYAVGTDHPRVGWSPRALPAVRDARLPGPDGIGTIAPLVGVGLVSPPDEARTVAVFTAGFKREHGAFRYGPLAQVNFGSHYGFEQEGVVLSRLEPKLATLYTTGQGEVHLTTWPEGSAPWMSEVRDARQNGVPLIETDAAGVGEPGPLVNRWGEGNWSGSANEDLRSLRAGLCLQEQGASRFLIFGYFSAATPSAMARVFFAYHCSYAMHLDMNALEHTYLALYVRQGGTLAVEHLLDGMGGLDSQVGGQLLPRFLAAPDNRDFFYLTRAQE